MQVRRAGLLMVLALLGMDVPADEMTELRRLMGEETFTGAGLEQLSARQLTVLERWLREQGVLQPPAPARADAVRDRAAEAPAAVTGPSTASAPPAEPRTTEPRPAAARQEGARDDDADEEVRSVIAGTFEGWSGSTCFPLQNGQIWQQRNPGRYAHRGDSVEVRVYRNFLGFHMLEVVETGRSIGVRRVQ